MVPRSVAAVFEFLVGADSYAVYYVARANGPLHDIEVKSLHRGHGWKTVASGTAHSRHVNRTSAAKVLRHAIGDAPKPRKRQQ